MFAGDTPGPCADEIEAAQAHTGYHSPVWKQNLFAASVIGTLGASWLLAMLCPAIMIFLRLEACSILEATYVRFQLENNRVVLLRVSTAVCGSSGPTSGRKQGHAGPTGQYVELSGCWFKFCPQSNIFVKVPRLPLDFNEQLERALITLRAIETGGEWASFNAASTWSRRQRVLSYGSNSLPIPKPNFAWLVWKQLTKPFIILAAIEIGLWMWSLAFYIYPAIVLSIIFSGTVLSSNAIYQQRKKLAAPFSESHIVPIVRKGYVHAASSRQLVPGDVIVLQQGAALCDMVLLRGSCLVDESKLTGEKALKRKVPFVPGQSPGVTYDPDIHKSSTLRAGGAIQQVWNEKDEQDEALAMVARTGLYTFVGQMCRSVFDPRWVQGQPEVRTSMGLLRQDVLWYFLLSGLIQLIIYLVLIPTLATSHNPVESALQQLLVSVLNSVQPLLPAIMVLVRALAVFRLRRQDIVVLDQKKMMMAGQLDVILFDKTGTLTIDESRLHGIVTCVRGKMQGLKSEAVAWSTDVKKVVALCHDLVPLSKGNLAGQLDERMAFADVEAAFLGRSTVCLPLRLHRTEPARTVKMEILHRFEYDAQWMMSGVVAKADTTLNERAQVLLKGAPHEVTQLLDPDGLPQDWLPAVSYWTAQGYRVLAMAAGWLLAGSAQDLDRVSLHTITQHTYGMRLLGFAVISNPLRSGSTTAISDLQDRGRLRTIMVTGDHPLTAVATAQVTGMLNYRRKHIILTSEAEYKCGKPEHLLSASSLGSTVNLPTQSLESFGRSLCTKSAMPYDRAAVAGNVTGISTRSASRSKSLSTAEFADKLTNEPRSRLSSRPLVVKPAVPSSIPKSQDGSVSGAAYSSQRGPVFIQQHLQATRQIATYTVEAGFSQFTPVQTEPASNPFVHTSSSDSYFFDTVATRTHLPLSNSITPCQTNMRGTASDSLASLSFALAEEGQIAPMAGSDAVDLIAQGHQCIITGSVFDCLLQHAEPALLKAVLCNVAVCACMGPQQKAQLVQLLGSHGLTLSSTRNFKGMGHVIGYCGDGINDLPALQVADVGLAVGASMHAVASASVVALPASVAGICTLIREARCSLVITFTVYQYMMLLGFMLAVTHAGIMLTDRLLFVHCANTHGALIPAHQYEVGWYISLALCVGFTCNRPAAQLYAIRPTYRLVSLPVLGFLALFMAFIIAQQGIAVAIVQQQSWFCSSETKTPVVSTILVIGTTQLVAPTFSFVSTMKPHCRGMRQNPVVPALVAIISLVWTVCLLYPNGFSEDLLLQRHLPLNFRIKLLCCTAASVILLAVLTRTVQWLNWHAKPIRKLSADTYIPTSSEMGGTLIGCKSYDGRDAVFRRTASTDVGDWLRRTASIVTDMTRLLPRQRPSNRVAQDMELMPV